MIVRKCFINIRFHFIIPGKTKRRFWVKFRLFSAHFPPIFRLWYPHPLFLSPHVYGIRLFLSIFCLKWYPIIVINSSMEPICCFSARMFMVFAHFPPNLLPIFRRSCLDRFGTRGNQRSTTKASPSMGILDSVASSRMSSLPIYLNRT